MQHPASCGATRWAFVQSIHTSYSGNALGDGTGVDGIGMVRPWFVQHREVTDGLDGRGKHDDAGISRSVPHVVAMDNGCTMEIGQPKL